MRLEGCAREESREKEEVERLRESRRQFERVVERSRSRDKGRADTQTKEKRKKTQVSRERQRNVLRFQWDDQEDTYDPEKEYLRQHRQVVRKEDKYLREAWNEKRLSQMTDRDWLIFREDN